MRRLRVLVSVLFYSGVWIMVLTCLGIVGSAQALDCSCLCVHLSHCFLCVLSMCMPESLMFVLVEDAAIT